MAESYDVKFLHQTTAIKVEAAALAKNIDVDSTTGMAAEEAISIVLDDASTHWDIITSITDGDTLVINSGIPTGRKAEVDAVVKTYYAYMLRQHDQVKDWLITEAPLLPQTLITASASPSSIEPEREIQISQVDWRKGIQDFFLEDEYKYYESENCDARMRGQVILSPKKLSSISFANAPTVNALLNPDLEDWTGEVLDDWSVLVGALPTKETSYLHSGTCAGMWHAGNNNWQTHTLYEDIFASGTLPTSLRGKVFTFAAWIRFQGILNPGYYGKVIVDDGASTTNGNSIITKGSYQKSTAAHTISATATQLRVEIKIYFCADTVNDNAWAYVDDASFTYNVANPSGSVVDTVEFGDDIIVAVGANLYSVGASSTTWLNTFPLPITDLCVFENRLYIAQGWSGRYFYTSNLTTFPECTLTGSTAKYMSVVGANFWISNTNNTMTDSDNPINGGTAFAYPYYTVGSDDWDITGLVDHDSIVFVRKEDQVYYLSVADVYPLLSISTEASTVHTYGMHLWGDCLYIPSGVNSLYEYDISSGIATVISPVRYAPGDANYDEEVLAICHDETYLYVAIDNGSDLKILAGRWETVDGDTDWYWHPIYDKTSNDITCMLISSLSSSKRLYAGTDTYSDGIYPFVVPVGYSAIYLESGFAAEASGTFITPWQTSSFPTEEKFWKSLDVTSICITDKTSITPYYQVKGGEWVAMAVCTTSTWAGSYPVEVTDSRTIGLSSERIRFKYEMAAADTDYTPILYGTGGGYVSFAVLQADRKRQIKATIQVAPYIRERNGSRIARTVATDLSNLRTLFKANDKMTVAGPDNTEYDTVFARNGYDEQLAYGEEIIRPENWWVTIKLLEL